MIKITDDFIDGEFNSINTYWMDHIHTWEQSAGKEMTVYQEDENGYKSSFLVVPDIAWNETFWNNKAVAEFYGMKPAQSVGNQ